MKILHFSDTHLGYTDLDKVSKKGINMREQDFYDAFQYVIDKALEIKPDLLIHSGDFFHRPSPANRPMIFALEQMKRLSDAGLPIVIIAGNHSTPKTIYTSPILQAFRTIPGVVPIFEQRYQGYEQGDVYIHGLPHINDDAVMMEELKSIKLVPGKFNILMLHTSVSKGFKMEEYGEKVFPSEQLDFLDQFDYVALGHWHNFQKVKGMKTSWYSGSTERMSDTETDKPKGYVLLDAIPGEAVNPVFHEVPARNWFRIDVQNCKEKSISTIETELKDACEKLEIKDCLLSIYLHDITVLQSVNLSNKIITELLPGPAHITVKRKFEGQDNPLQSLNTKTEKIETLVREFIKKKVDSEEKAKSLSEKALYYFDLFENRKK